MAAAATTANSTHYHTDLPSLESVLNRRTAPPVCLYNFYIIMRDRLHMEEVLDFYLDVQHHEQLWRRYVRSMRRSGYLTEEDLAEGYQSPRLLSRLSHVSSSVPDEKRASSPLTPPSQHTNNNNKQNLQQQQRLQEDFLEDDGERRYESSALSGPVTLERPPLTEHSEKLHRKAQLNRQDLTDSANRIMLRYLVPSASKEVTQLPVEMKVAIRRQIEENGRDDPLVFAEAKDYLFEYMRRYAYPKFLRVKVWGNVTLWQQMGRLVLGLVALLAGLTTGFSLIFLGYPQWGTRFWVLLPLWIGVLNIFTFLTGLDPLWVLLLNFSETTTFHFNKIRQPEVKRVLVWRSIWLLFVTVLIAIVLTIIFAAVPSKRL